LATPAFAALGRSETIYEVGQFSDHAIITLGYDFTL
jgi:exodeoxyribonuclease-3